MSDNPLKEVININACTVSMKIFFVNQAIVKELSVEVCRNVSQYPFKNNILCLEKVTGFPLSGDSGGFEGKLQSK